jgi:uncharacterized protein (DUF952 family)
VIYKLLASQEWEQARAVGRYDGSADDRRDGFIHFSGPDQVVATAGRIFAGQRGLTLLAVDPAPLGVALRWEPSRGGELFPHLYGSLPISAVFAVRTLSDQLSTEDAVAAAVASITSP